MKIDKNVCDRCGADIKYPAGLKYITPRKFSRFNIKIKDIDYDAKGFVTNTDDLLDKKIREAEDKERTLAMCVEVNIVGSTHRYDLCPKCAKEYRKFMKDFLGGNYHDLY